MVSLERLSVTLEEIRDAGLYKTERIITTPQRVEIKVQGGEEVLNFCANNYLGLADNPEVIAAAHQALDDHGFGLASVRFICGTQDLHKQLEQTISDFLVPRIQSCTHHVLMPMVGFLRHCWGQRMP